ncbi:hypothetical protein DUZ99_12220 [Xylanibacillus composti]|uniref:Phytanoyl-CoA dioxygenase n=1 Tax=Xylanibacillus composti TaxID=1572762 RepID=A0A8J4H0X0_9BACL|nr:hypothetical protein [Xylanibacillus composti]MDT9725740.1 hypothetical protein [Xylanibacillus composti]GIQ67546.1 hypothetical protein XYCOK13_03700 [Xylanibacillus composti]
MPKVLSNEQIEHFMEKGWVKVDQAFPREEALKVQDFLWDRLAEHGVDRDDKSTWTKPLYRLGNYTDSVADGCNTDRLTGAVEDLIGEGRWREGNKKHNAVWGGFIINFGPEVPGGWHYDGSHFHHYLDSWEQGLLFIGLFSEVRPGGSGTLVAEGSHNIVAKVLAEHPKGLPLGEAIKLCNRHPWLAELVSLQKKNADDDIYADESPADNRAAKKAHLAKFMNTTYQDPDGYSLRVVETTGSPGDVVLCHPFLYHSASDNDLGIPRFMCNRCTPTHEPMNFNRSRPEEYSIVEKTIRRSLGLKDHEGFPFKRA